MSDIHLTTTPHTTLETLWAASRVGLITWESVQQYQASLMPRCTNHPDRAAPVVWEGAAVCADCVTAMVAAMKEQGHEPRFDRH